MINQNMVLKKEGNQFVFRLDGPEIESLFNKHGGAVNVKVSKPVSPGTDEQNRAFHSLLTEYYKTGLHSAPEGYTLAEFKNFMKIQYGPHTFIDVGEAKYRVLKSWADYTKHERMAALDGLISEVNQSGAYAESEKIREIIGGLSHA